jgi:hypothetical protein
MPMNDFFGARRSYISNHRIASFQFEMVAGGAKNRLTQVS